jgi:aldose 1-epimerase
LASGPAALVLDPEAGGRIASLTVLGRELLVTGTNDDHPMTWGSFPMVPWAGRVRHGVFSFDERVYELELNLPPHAIHGTGFCRPWSVAGDGSLTLDLVEGWPFGGTARQRFELHHDHLVCVLEVEATDQPMPAQVGWHPWFVKPERLGFEATAMYVLDDEGMPTGELGEPSAGPWDDCFTGVHQPVVLDYGELTIEVSSSCDHWVVYDQPEQATCVEPQSGPPDGFTLRPAILGPGEVLRHSMTIGWRTPR